MALAHDGCLGDGIEIGAAAHNPFNLPGCLNVANQDDYEFFKDAQVQMCGSFAEVDHFAEAEALPFADSSLDYVISSHVVEHIPNFPQAFVEWNRVVKDCGVVFMVIPKRDAHPDDAKLPLAHVHEIWDNFKRGATRSVT